MKRISELDLGFETHTKDPKELLRMGVDSMTDSRQQPKIENWILVNFSQVYNRDRSDKFEWVKRGDPPAPDFLVLHNQTPTRSR